MQQMKFFFGGSLILIAVAYLIYSSTQMNKEYFMTVDEVKAAGADVAGKSLRLSGAVVGDTVQYDAKTLTLTFEVAQISGDNAEIEAQGGLADALKAAVADPTRARIKVVYNGVKPDLLRNEAQAIMTGHMGADGIFYAEELLLKCPTKYEESVPQQAGG